MLQREANLFVGLPHGRLHDSFIGIHPPARETDLTLVVGESLGTSSEQNFSAMRTISQGHEDGRDAFVGSRGWM